MISNKRKFQFLSISNKIKCFIRNGPIKLFNKYNDIKDDDAENGSVWVRESERGEDSDIYKRENTTLINIGL